MRKKIETFLESFPKNTTSWAKATDEIRDLARMSRECLEKYEGIIINPVDFSHIKTPSEWNTQGRDYILANFDRMQEFTKQIFFKEFQEWFEPDINLSKKIHLRNNTQKQGKRKLKI